MLIKYATYCALRNMLRKQMPESIFGAWVFYVNALISKLMRLMAHFLIDKCTYVLIYLTMIITINELQILKDGLKNVIEDLNFLMSSVHRQNGCIRAEIFISEKEQCNVMLYEEWASMTQFQKHLKSNLSKQFFSLYELSIIKPEIKIFECDSIKDFAWVESIIINSPLI